MSLSKLSTSRKIGLLILVPLFILFGYFESKHYIFDIKNLEMIDFTRPSTQEYVYNSHEALEQIGSNPRWSHQALVATIFCLLAILIVHFWFNNRTFTRICMFIYGLLGLTLITLFLIGLGLNSYKVAYELPRTIKNAFITSPFLPFFLVAVGSLFKLRK